MDTNCLWMRMFVYDRKYESKGEVDVGVEDAEVGRSGSSRNENKSTGTVFLFPSFEKFNSSTAPEKLQILLLDDSVNFPITSIHTHTFFMFPSPPPYLFVCAFSFLIRL